MIRDIKSILRDKNTYFFLVFQVIIIFIQGIRGGSNLPSVYAGYPLSTYLYEYIFIVAQFVNFSVYMYGTARNYIEGYGIYEIIRIKKKTALLGTIVKLIWTKLAIFECVKLITFFICSFISKNMIQNIREFLFAFVMTLLIELTLVCIQMYGEIKDDSRSGVLIISVFYTFSMVAPIFLKMENEDVGKFMIFFPNLSMINRVNSFQIWYMAIAYIILIGGLVLFMILKLIKKKDVI